MAANKKDGISRLERAAQARKLRDRGLLLREIRKELRISHGYASSLLTDPDGSIERKRKDRYRNICIDCGGQTTHSHPSKEVLRCFRCASKYRTDNRKWTSERIIERIRSWNDLYGEPPTAMQWLMDARGDGTYLSREWPCVQAVQREFGSWSNGLEAAGFARRSCSYERTPEWKAKVTKWPKERIIQALRTWAEVNGEVPSSADYWRIPPYGPSTKTVMDKFGSWSNAMHEAGLTPRGNRRNGTPPPVLPFSERGEGTPLLEVVRNLHLPVTRTGKSLLDVVRELPERS